MPLHKGIFMFCPGDDGWYGLEGTYTLVQNNYVFSKEKLTQWVNNRIEHQ